MPVLGGNNNDSEEEHYTEVSLYRDDKDDSIIDNFLNYKISTMPAPQDDAGVYWGALDPGYTEMDLQTLVKTDSFDEFKRYYYGDVSEEQWRNWRDDLFTYNRGTWVVDIESDFYDIELEDKYDWYNPIGWWYRFNAWLFDPIIIEE
jgi:hypothetical protein